MCVTVLYITYKPIRVKKIFSILLIIATMITTLSVSANDDNYFVVTAYYSPLPGQDYYITGNYEDELILN
jgi:hypothetical protein